MPTILKNIFKEFGNLFDIVGNISNQHRYLVNIYDMSKDEKTILKLTYNNLSEKIFNSSDKESIYGYYNKTCNDINKFEHDFFKKNNIEIKILPQKHINDKEIANDILKKVYEEIENGNLQYDRECK